MSGWDGNGSKSEKSGPKWGLLPDEARLKKTAPAGGKLGPHLKSAGPGDERGTDPARP